MAKNLSPMYCRLDAIEGMHDERDRAERLLQKHLKGTTGIILLALDDVEWVYGQANFAHEDGKPFKFIDRITTIASNGVLDTLALEGKPSAILFSNKELKIKLEQHKSFSRVKHLFKLIPEFRTEPQSGIFTTIKKFFFAPPIDTSPKYDEAESFRRHVETYCKRMMSENKLSELLLCMFSTYSHCSLDKAQEALESRIKANPNDTIALTGLVLLLADFGDYDTALTLARSASKLQDPPPELFMWYAKAAWWEGHEAEGLEALSKIESIPAHWPRIVRRGIEALRAALFSQQNHHVDAVRALNEAIEIDACDYALNLCLAQELLTLGNIDEAQLRVEDAEVLSPANPIIRVEMCRIFEAKEDTTALGKALSKLCLSERGLLEARRFTACEKLEVSNSALPEQFRIIDHDRLRSLYSSLLPTWFDLCLDSPVAHFFNMYLLYTHRPENDPIKALSVGYKELMNDPLNAVVHAGMAAAWLIAERPQLAIPWARSALALDPSIELHHSLYVISLKLSKEFDKAYDAAILATVLDKANENTTSTGAHLFWSIPRINDMLQMSALPYAREKLRENALAKLDDPDFRSAALIGLSIAAFIDDETKTFELQSEAIKLDPDRDSYHELHIQMLEMAGQEKQAALALERRAEALRRTHPEFTADIFGQYADVLMDAELYSKAHSFIIAGLQMDPASTELRLIQAQILLRLKRREEAFDQLRLVSNSETTDSAKALCILGDELSEDGRHDEALESWILLQKLEPDSAIGFLNAGLQSWYLDRDAEAADLVSRAISKDDSNPYSWAFLGQILWSLGRLEEALQPLKHALSFKPTPRKALLNLAIVLSSLDRTEEALTLCDTILDSDPRNAEAAIGRAEALCASGALEKAFEFGLNWTLQSEADIKDLICMRATIEKWIGLKAAITVGETGLSKHPDAVALLLSQSRGAAALGKFEHARSLAHKAMELQPDELESIEAYTQACIHLDDIATIEVEALAKRLVENEQHTSYTLQLAADLLRAGNFETRSAYETALNARHLDSPPDGHGIAWCLLHLGRQKEALDLMDSYIIVNPNNTAALLDRTIIGFLAFNGDQTWTNRLTEILQAVRGQEKGEGYVAELRALIKQWRRQGVADHKTLAEMQQLVDRSTEC